LLETPRFGASGNHAWLVVGWPEQLGSCRPWTTRRWAAASARWCAEQRPNVQ